MITFTQITLYQVKFSFSFFFHYSFDLLFWGENVYASGNLRDRLVVHGYDGLV